MSQMSKKEMYEESMYHTALASLKTNEALKGFHVGLDDCMNLESWEDYDQQLELFDNDPPDSEFQEGYLVALKLQATLDGYNVEGE